MNKQKNVLLHCSCCDQNFYGKQHWNHDKGYGTCLSCCEWIKKRWPQDAILNIDYKANKL